MISEALRLIRTRNDLKQKELANIFNISQGYLSEIEHGIKVPSLEILDLYVNTFEMKLSAIFLLSEELDERKYSREKNINKYRQKSQDKR